MSRVVQVALLLALCVLVVVQAKPHGMRYIALMLMIMCSNFDFPFLGCSSRLS